MHEMHTLTFYIGIRQVIFLAFYSRLLHAIFCSPYADSCHLCSCTYDILDTYDILHTFAIMILDSDSLKKKLYIGYPMALLLHMFYIADYFFLETEFLVIFIAI